MTGSGSASSHLVAAAVTALALPSAAHGFKWSFPAGCDLRGDPERFRWTCRLPGLLQFAAPVVAMAMLVGAWSVAALRRFIETRPFQTVLIAGAATHLVMLGVYLVGLDPAYRMQFLREVPGIPQPLLAGAVSAALYVGAQRLLSPWNLFRRVLHIRSRRAVRP